MILPAKTVKHITETYLEIQLSAKIQKQAELGFSYIDLKESEYGSLIPILVLNDYTVSVHNDILTIEW